MHVESKIQTLPELAAIVAECKRHGKRVVHCHGVFDLLHIGHIRYFRQAAEMGDVLIVTVTQDQHVDKGPHRPAFPEALRLEGVVSQHNVDYGAINPWATAEELLRFLRPDVYVKGSDFKNVESDPTGKLQREAEVCRELGIELRLTQDEVFSSTNLINRFLSSFPDDVQEYLEIFRSRYSIDQIEKILEAMRGLKVTVVGDTILDDYQYCSPLGAASKDPVMALRGVGGDVFAGGVLAVANHLSNFVGEVKLYTVLGEADCGKWEGFVRESLHGNVTPNFAYQKDAPTIRKRRYLEGYSMTKLLEIYHMDDSGLDAERDARFRQAVMQSGDASDVVVAADFGHGTISQDCRGDLVRAPFLAVNTQANAGNRGFHTISRYERCGFVSLAEPELRLDARDTKTGIIPLADRLQKKTQASMVAVTRGKQGSFIQTADGTGVLVPAFASKVVDRIGSGDAFFSMASLGACMKVNPELVGFLGNVIGSIAVGILGNKKSITQGDVMKLVTSLLK